VVVWFHHTINLLSIPIGLIVLGNDNCATILPSFRSRTFIVSADVFPIFTRESQMLRASLSSSGRLSVCPSVCLSVRHTRDLYQNGASYDHEIFTVGCPKVSSLSWQNFVPLDAGVPLERGRRRGVPPKKTSFAVIGSNNVKTVADRCIHAAYHNKHWWQAFGIY